MFQSSSNFASFSLIGPLFASARMRTKLLLGFGAVLVLILFLSVFTYLSVQSIEQVQLPARKTMREITVSTLEMRLQARLFLSDTISSSSQKDDFYISGQSSYLTRFDAEYEKFNQNIDLLNGYEQQIGVNQTQTRKLKTLVDSYRDTFFKMVALYEERGFVDHGLEGKMRDVAHELEAKYQSAPDKLVTLLQARRHEKDFFLRQSNEYVELFDAEINTLKSKAVDDPTELQLVNSYSQLFHQIVELELKLGSDSGKGLYNQLLMTGTSFEETIEAEEKMILSLTDATISRIRFLIIVVTLILILIGLGLSQFIANAIIASLLEVKTAAEEISGGDLTKRITIASNDEVAELSNAFNVMAEKLEGTLKTVETKNVALSSSVAENKKVQSATLNILEDLEAAKRKVEEEKAKDEAILESIGDGVVVTDQSGVILFVNQIVPNLLGWTASEFINKRWVEDLPKTEDNSGNLIAKEERALYKALQTGQKNNASYIYLKKDGSKLPVSVTASPVVLADKVIGAIVVFRDVTKEHEVDRMKTEFISLASHQLRTPLTAMKWFSEMLLSGDGGPLNPEQTEFVKNINDSNERMIELVNGLLNISRIESGRLIVEPVPSDLNKLVEDVLTELKPRIEGKKQKLIFSHHENLPQISVDPKLIRQVYSNLLTNSIKYSPEEAEISIFISEKDNEIVSQISDTGYGIPKAEQAKVFAKFYRGTNITTKETDGTGLGLYLIKSIIESSGGKIWFESQEGQGTSFFFSLPMTGMKEHKGEVHIND